MEPNAQAFALLFVQLTTPNAQWLAPMAAWLLTLACQWLLAKMEPNVQACAQSNAQKIICTVEVEWMLLDAQCLTHVCQWQVNIWILWIRLYSVERQWRLGWSIPFIVLVNPYFFYCSKRVWISQNKKSVWINKDVIVHTVFFYTWSYLVINSYFPNSNI